MGRRQRVFSGLTVILPAIVLGISLAVGYVSIGLGQDSVRTAAWEQPIAAASGTVREAAFTNNPNSGAKRTGGFKNYTPPAQANRAAETAAAAHWSGTPAPAASASAFASPPSGTLLPQAAAPGAAATVAQAPAAQSDMIDSVDVPEFPYGTTAAGQTPQPAFLPDSAATAGSPAEGSSVESILPESPLMLQSNLRAAPPAEASAAGTAAETAAEPILPETPPMAPAAAVAEARPSQEDPLSQGGMNVESAYPPASASGPIPAQGQSPLLVAQTPVNIPPAANASATPPAAPQPTTAQQAAPQQDPGGQAAPLIQPSADGIIPPPENFSMTREQEALLDQFLLRWEEFGKKIKRVSCEVQITEHDGGVFLRNTGNSKIPLSHTWGKFKFIAPNKLLYHVEGEYVYQPGASSDDEPKMEFKKGSGELKYVCDGKSWAEYDFRNRIVNVYPIPEDQWNMDLSMDGPFPLFFIANAKNLKNRFYMNLVTPKGRQDQEVWIEAYPRQAVDAGSFQRIIIILRLSDLQPSYMRKYYVNGKSYSELWFQNVSLNKGIWNIEATVDFGWEKKVKEESFTIAPIAPPVQQVDPNLPSSGVIPEE